MRIDQIAVDGFGLLRDRRLEPAPGLTLIRGENEAGKSTLLAFIRAVLFGFEPKSPGALVGGLRGGWLTVTTGDGRPVRIERHGITGGTGQLRVLDQDGDDLGPETLTRILQGVEKSVYRNIFAFGLAELTEFDSLTGPAIADRIYGAGMGTGTTSVVEVENALEKVRTDIFVKRGRVPRINVLLAEIEELDARIDAINPPEIFRTAGARRAALEAELATISADAEAIEIRRRRLERLRDGWSSWLALEAARRRLAELPTEPADGRPALASDLLERLAGVETALAKLTEDATDLAVERTRALAEREAAAVDEGLLAARPAAEALLAELGEARSDRARIVDRERDLAERSAAVAEAVRRLGPGWDEARVAGVDDSLEAQGAISGHFRTLLEGTERDLASARSAANTAAQNQADATAELAAVATPGSMAALTPAPNGPPAGRPAPPPSWRVSPAWLLIGLLVGLLAFEGGLLLGAGGLAALLAGLVAGFVTALAGPRLRGPLAQPAIGSAMLDNPLAARIAERTERLNLLVERNALAQRRLAEATEAAAQAGAAWDAWLADHGLPAGIDRETATRILDGVRSIRTGLLGLATAQGRRTETATRLTDFEDRGAAFLAGLGRPTDDPIAGLEAVRRDLAASVAAVAVRDRAQRELERAEAAQRANGAALEAAHAGHAAILAEAGATDGSGVRAAVAAAAERAGIEHQIESAEDNPGRAVGTGSRRPGPGGGARERRRPSEHRDRAGDRGRARPGPR